MDDYITLSYMGEFYFIERSVAETFELEDGDAVKDQKTWRKLLLEVIMTSSENDVKDRGTSE